jgi:hypothetical protein
MKETPVHVVVRSPWKKRVVILLVLIGMVTIAYGYYSYISLMRQVTDAENILSENVRLTALNGVLETTRTAAQEEYTRCQDFISQREGDFGSFEYCKHFIDWYGGLP